MTWRELRDYATEMNETQLDTQVYFELPLGDGVAVSLPVKIEDDNGVILKEDR